MGCMWHRAKFVQKPCFCGVRPTFFIFFKSVIFPRVFFGLATSLLKESHCQTFDSAHCHISVSCWNVVAREDRRRPGAQECKTSNASVVTSQFGNGHILGLHIRMSVVHSYTISIVHSYTPQNKWPRSHIVFRYASSYTQN